MIRLYETRKTFNNINNFRLENDSGYYVSLNSLQETFEKVETTKMIGLSAEEIDYFNFVVEFENMKELRETIKNVIPEYFI